jgi:dihydrofolate reductase
LALHHAGNLENLSSRYEVPDLFSPNFMSKLIAAINVTLDGFCDHTAMIADEEMHQHYADLLSTAAVILYGRKTFQLMEYWQSVVQKPMGDKATDEFALIIDKVPKIVFSRTLEHVAWKSAKLAVRGLEEEVSELRQQSGKDILVGSPSLIASLTKLHLIDEYQLCVHPVIIGSGLPLFKDINDSVTLKLLKTKTFGSGAVVLYYESTKRD